MKLQEDDEGQSAINTLVGLILESKDEVNVPGLEIILECASPLATARSSQY